MLAQWFYFTAQLEVPGFSIPEVLGFTLPASQRCLVSLYRPVRGAGLHFTGLSKVLSFTLQRERGRDRGEERSSDWHGDTRGR